MSCESSKVPCLKCILQKTDCNPFQSDIQLVTLFSYFPGTTEQLHSEESPFACA